MMLERWLGGISSSWCSELPPLLPSLKALQDGACITLVWRRLWMSCLPGPQQRAAVNQPPASVHLETQERKGPVVCAPEPLSCAGLCTSCVLERSLAFGDNLSLPCICSGTAVWANADISGAGRASVTYFAIFQARPKERQRSWPRNTQFLEQTKRPGSVSVGQKTQLSTVSPWGCELPEALGLQQCPLDSVWGRLSQEVGKSGPKENCPAK